MENCRNCKWADWRRDASGRRQFQYRAKCTYLGTAVLPLSRFQARVLLSIPAYVFEHRKVAIECPAWEKR